MKIDCISAVEMRYVVYCMLTVVNNAKASISELSSEVKIVGCFLKLLIREDGYPKEDHVNLCVWILEGITISVSRLSILLFAVA